MRIILLLIMYILLIPVCHAHEIKKAISNGQKNSDSMMQKLEVIQYFDDYMQHYNDYLSNTDNTNALQAMANSYHIPAFQVIPGVPLRTLSSAENLAKGSQAFLDSLLAQGVAYVKWEKVHIEMLTDKTAYASNIGVRYKKNGDVFNKAAADYIMFKTDHGWKIAALILHLPGSYKNPNQEQAVSHFFANYLKNYNDTLSYDDDSIGGNIASLVATGEDLHIPAINISASGEFLLFESKQQVIADTKFFIFQLIAKGVAHINYDKIQIKMLTETTAIASNIAAINKTDGTSLSKIGVTYIIHKTSDGWKIILRTTHTPEAILNMTQISI